MFDLDHYICDDQDNIFAMFEEKRSELGSGESEEILDLYCQQFRTLRKIADAVKVPLFAFLTHGSEVHDKLCFYLLPANKLARVFVEKTFLHSSIDNKGGIYLSQLEWFKMEAILRQNTLTPSEHDISNWKVKFKLLPIIGFYAS